jgi:hypothetical protein
VKPLMFRLGLLGLMSGVSITGNSGGTVTFDANAIPSHDQGLIRGRSDASRAADANQLFQMMSAV